MTQKDPEIITFGCRLNAYESEVIKNHARTAGLQNAIIINTCAVTAAAESEARQAIRRLRRDHPDAQIIVTGCAAQIDPQKFGAMPEVTRVIGNDLKLKPETWGLPAGEKILVNDIMSVRETAPHLIEGMEGHARAFIEVQNGCDHRCTFCIIPYGRGPSRSVPMGAIADQVRALVAAGYNEIVMSGVDVTSYGPDLPGAPSLGQMMTRVLAAVPELKRLRLSSLDPVEIDEDMWRLIADEPRLMPHLHLSLQAGDDMILKRMKRRHSAQDVRDVVARACALRPDMAFGCDIIAGFPTEDDDMFARSADLIRELKIAYVHVFPYSPRAGTPAARMPQVKGDVIRRRAAALRAIGDENLTSFLRSMVGRPVQALTESGGMARAENFAPIEVQGEDLPKAGALKTLVPQGLNAIGDKLVAHAS